MLYLLAIAALTLNPEELLRTAAKKVVMCGYEKPERFVLDAAHQPTDERPKEVKAGDDPTKKISIPVLFRKGRYRLEDGGTTYLEGRETMVVNFFPVPEKEMLKPAGTEDKRFSRAMNFLTGSAFLDKETGGIVRVEARTLTEVPYEALFLTLFKIHELKLIFEQQLVENKWVPRRLDLEWHGRSKAGIVNRHELYRITFACDSE